MSEKDYIEQLEKSIEKLEAFMKSIFIGEYKDIHFHNSPIGDVSVGEGCNLSFHQSSIGGIIQDIDDAENRIDELEGRLQGISDELEGRLQGIIGELEERLQGIIDQLDEIEKED